MTSKSRVLKSKLPLKQSTLKKYSLKRTAGMKSSTQTTSIALQNETSRKSLPTTPHPRKSTSRHDVASPVILADGTGRRKVVIHTTKDSTSERDLDGDTLVPDVDASSTTPEESARLEDLADVSSMVEHLKEDEIGRLDKEDIGTEKRIHVQTTIDIITGKDSTDPEQGDESNITVDGKGAMQVENASINSSRYHAEQTSHHITVSGNELPESIERQESSSIDMILAAASQVDELAAPKEDKLHQQDDNDPTYDVEAIVGYHRIGRNASVQIKWVGWEEPTWEKVSWLKHNSGPEVIEMLNNYVEARRR